jgi:predicted nucleotidyltransferase
MIKKMFNLVYEIIFLLLRSDLHGRAISRQLGIPLTTVQLELKSLCDMNVIDYAVQGRNKVFSIKKNVFARQLVFSAENYRLIRLMDKYPHLSPLIEDLVKSRRSTMIILFGSYAKFSAKKDSDIDLFIESTSIKAKKDIESLNSSLSVKIGRFNRDDLLIKEIINNHVIIAGVEEYYERLGFFGETKERRKD